MGARFITATGTGVGKTFVTAALAHQLREAGRAVRVLKPVVTGFSPETAATSDPAVLLRALGREADGAAIAAMATLRFAAPLAPVLAAALEQRTLDVQQLIALCRAAEDADATLLIEGVGGVMVPLTDEFTVLDWMAALGHALILVTGSYLGTLSHTLTAVEVVRSRGLSIAGLVVCASDTDAAALADTVNILTRFTELPVHAIPRMVGAEPWRRAPQLLDLVAPLVRL
jgi:dethiobiotin synthetase